MFSAPAISKDKGSQSCKDQQRTKYALRNACIGSLAPFFWLEERYAPLCGTTSDPVAFPRSLLVRSRRTSGQGVRRMNCDRIACREGHFECLVETRVEGLFGLGFLDHDARPL